jgi:hypothetical protein
MTFQGCSLVLYLGSKEQGLWDCSQEIIALFAQGISGGMGRYVSTVANCIRNATFGGTFAINGWVTSVRKQKNIAFIQVNDGSTVRPLQLVASPNTAER